MSTAQHTEAIRRRQELRRSNAAGAHQPRRRSRGATKRRAIRADVQAG